MALKSKKKRHFLFFVFFISTLQDFRIVTGWFGDCKAPTTTTTTLTGLLAIMASDCLFDFFCCCFCRKIFYSIILLPIKQVPRLDGFVKVNENVVGYSVIMSNGFIEAISLFETCCIEAIVASGLKLWKAVTTALSIQNTERTLA